MTRKRFIKLLMARGYSRNFAVAMADARTDASYEEHYNNLTRYAKERLLLESVRIAADNLRLALCYGLSAVCDTLGATFSALAETFAAMADIEGGKTL